MEDVLQLDPHSNGNPRPDTLKQPTDFAALGLFTARRLRVAYSDIIPLLGHLLSCSRTKRLLRHVLARCGGNPWMISRRLMMRVHGYLCSDPSMMILITTLGSTHGGVSRMGSVNS
jgi:hypothetical protein